MNKKIKGIISFLLVGIMMFGLLSPVSASMYFPAYNGATVSIYDALSAIDVDNSFSNRERIAKANGINDYVGSSEQNLYLLSKLKDGTLVNPDNRASEELADTRNTYQYYPACESYHYSITDALKAVQVDSSFSNRERIAEINGIKNYVGSSSQNNTMLSLLKNGKLINPDAVINTKLQDAGTVEQHDVEIPLNEATLVEISPGITLPIETPHIETFFDATVPAENENFVSSVETVNDTQEINPEKSEQNEPIDKITEKTTEEIVSEDFVNTKDEELSMESYGATDYKDYVNAEERKYFPAYTGNSASISDALEAQGVDNSYTYRALISQANNIDNYIGSAEQNTKLLSLLKEGKLIKPEYEMYFESESEAVVLSSGESSGSFDMYSEDDVLIEVTKNNSPVREKASKWSNCVKKSSKGVVFKVEGNTINKFGNLWYEIEYDSRILYIFSGNVEIHKCKEKKLEKYGVVYSLCDCGRITYEVKSFSQATVTGMKYMIAREEGSILENAEIKTVSMTAMAPTIMQYAVTAGTMSQLDGPFLPFGDIAAIAIMLYAGYVAFNAEAPSLEYIDTVDAVIESVDDAFVEEFFEADNKFCIVVRPPKKGNLICTKQNIDIGCAYAIVMSGRDIYTKNKSNAECLASMHKDYKTKQPRYYYDAPHISSAPYSYAHFHLGVKRFNASHIKDVPSHIFFEYNLIGQIPVGYKIFSVAA